ncbi:MAG: HAMP domain-containing sensor histidine kinase [Caulobacterales bacterium]
MTLIYMALFCGSIFLMLGAMYVGGVWRPLQVVENSIRKASDQFTTTYRLQGRDALLRALQDRATHATGRLPYHVFVAPDGAVISANLADWPTTRGAEWLRYEFGTYATGSEEEHEAVVRDLLLPDGYRLLVGLDTEDLDEREDFIFEALSWGTGVTLLLGALGGLVMTLAVSRRLESINRAARAVIGGDLSGRVELHGSGDDFDQLSATLNEMLERIENLVASISRVSDSIAHELRTPLARLQAELEDLDSASTAPETKVRVIAALAEAGRLQGMFESLLRLARLQDGGGEVFEKVNLSLIVEDAVELYRPLAEEKGQKLAAEVAPDLMLHGARDLLFQMISNVIDNSIKFTPPEGKIEVRAVRESEGIVLSVADNGPGIPAQDKDRVLERFYRVPNARRADGFGLGLSLVAAAAARHGAKLLLEDAAPGLRVIMRFPGR